MCDVLSVHTPVLGIGRTVPILQCGNRGSERWSKWAQVAQLVSGRAGMQTRVSLSTKEGNGKTSVGRIRPSLLRKLGLERHI